VGFILPLPGRDRVQSFLLQAMGFDDLPAGEKDGEDLDEED